VEYCELSYIAHDVGPNNFSILVSGREDLVAGDDRLMRLFSGPSLEMVQRACLILQAVFWQVVGIGRHYLARIASGVLQVCHMVDNRVVQIHRMENIERRSIRWSQNGQLVVGITVANLESS
jgi:hypothetical protein